MGIPPGETPVVPTESVASIITDPLLSTETGVMSIPAGETPISIFTSLTDVSTLPSRTSVTAPVLTTTTSTTQQTTNAAAPLRVGESVPMALAAVLALL